MHLHGESSRDFILYMVYTIARIPLPVAMRLLRLGLFQITYYWHLIQIPNVQGISSVHFKKIGTKYYIYSTILDFGTLSCINFFNNDTQVISAGFFFTWAEKLRLRNIVLYLRMINTWITKISSHSNSHFCACQYHIVLKFSIDKIYAKYLVT